MRLAAKWVVPLLLGIAALAPLTARAQFSCAQTLACVMKCAEADATCVLTCKQQRSTEAEELYFYLEACLSAVCPGTPPDPVCVFEATLNKCGPEYEACVLGGSCQGDCAGKECGDDGCGGNCADCPANYYCIDHVCVLCTPDCLGKECGDNGCGATCGECPPGSECTENMCISTECTPNCFGKVCGSNGCNGSCGTCGNEEYCDGGVCVAGEPPPDTGNTEPEIVTEGDATGQPEGDGGSGEQCPPGKKFFFGQCVDDPEYTGNGGEGDNPCPAGMKLFFGQCIEDPDADSGSEGCSVGKATPYAVWLSLMLLLLAVAVLRRPTS